MLKFNNIHVTLGGKVRLQITTFNIDNTTMFGLLGPNGAGKSTLLKTISHDVPYSGQIIFHDKPLNQWNSFARARHIGVLPQNSNLTFQFSAKEVVSLGLIPLSLNRKQGEDIIYQHMLATDCHHLADQAYPSLSGGERQRVQLARVLTQLSQAEQPPLLLLDEPTSAQDLGHQHTLLQLVTSLNKEKNYMVLVVLHDLNQALRYCEQSCILYNGEIIEQGATKTILNPPNIEKYWQYKPTMVKIKDDLEAVF